MAIVRRHARYGPTSGDPFITPAAVVAGVTALAKGAKFVHGRVTAEGPPLSFDVVQSWRCPVERESGKTVADNFVIVEIRNNTTHGAYLEWVGAEDGDCSAVVLPKAGFGLGTHSNTIDAVPLPITIKPDSTLQVAVWVRGGTWEKALPDNGDFNVQFKVTIVGGPNRGSKNHPVVCWLREGSQGA